jgi:surface carbohydrate biosynthesis protein
MTTDPYRTLILPCETRVREFDAKLLLACRAAEQGYRVIVGVKRVIDLNAARLPRGIYMAKSVTNRNFFHYRTMRKLGHVLSAWDEEGLVYASQSLYHRTKVGSQTLPEPVGLFAWGEANADAWRSHSAYAGQPIYATGNPRTDLLRPELRDLFAAPADALRDRYGDFVLVNTNFSRLNHYYGWQSFERRLLQDGGDAITDDADPRLGLAAHKAALFEHFIAMVPRIAKRYPNTTLIVRPHPSENARRWIDAARDCPNVRVVHEGNIAAWLLAARAMIHNGCTTAVESFLLDRPALAFRPVTSDQFDHPLPNALSLDAFDLESLGDRVGLALAADGPADAESHATRQNIARHHIASYDGDDACSRILTGLDRLATEQPRHALSMSERLLGLTRATARSLAKRTAGLIPHNPNHSGYRRHLFPPITRSDVNETVANFGRLLGRFDRIRVVQRYENVFDVTCS